ncbi:HCP-like protein, partial [Microstroma glucosiphilum]
MGLHPPQRIHRSATSDVNPPGPNSSTSDRFWAPQSQPYPDGYPSGSGPRRGSLPVVATSPVPTSSVIELRRASASSQASHSSSDSSVAGAPRLSLSLPTMGSLARRREAAIASGEERQKVQWARRVMRYVEREHGTAAKVNDPTLLRWIDDAMATINRRAGASPPDPEALYLRGDLKASGNFSTYHVKDPRDAFTDFEKSGRAGFPASWYRIGRDYELHHSYALSKDAYERGCQLQDTNSTFRMGRAYLFGQLKVKQDFEKALPLLRLAADMANEDLPEPGFFYGQLHAGEYAHLNIPDELIRPSPHGSPSSEQLALRYIERAAYLNHASAQLKLGWAYEYAKIQCPFDPLLSVQYYSLASKGGKAEADVALSRWFLCGAEGCFEKNEALAFTFAEKATRRNLPAAEFALAYYYEVGVGCDKDLPLAMKWYRRSAAQGNADAQTRLTALAASTDAAVSRSQYEAELDSQMTRGHTAARNLS